MKIHNYSVLATLLAVQQQVQALVETWGDSSDNAMTQQLTCDLSAKENDVAMVYRFRPNPSKDMVRIAVLTFVYDYDQIVQPIELQLINNIERTLESKSLTVYQEQHGYSCYPPGPGMAGSALSAAIYMWLWQGQEPNGAFQIYSQNEPEEPNAA